MRIGIVGCGSIAQRAYLPVLTQRADVDLILCTRNDETLNQLKAQYHLTEGVKTIEELIDLKPTAIFLSAATEAHYVLAKKVLDAKIALYIDKPISMNLDEVKDLSALAKKNNIIFMTGFNRRYVPIVKEVHDKGVPDIVIYQKNRHLKADTARRFLVEDFIHVIDTSRYLLQAEVKDIRVHYKLEDKKLAHVVIHLITDVNSAVCITNYLNGCTEEIIDVMHKYEKSVVKNLAELEWYIDDEKHLALPKDWQPTLKKRGFEDLIEDFIQGLRNNQQTISIDDAYRSHEICDYIAKEIEKTL